MYNQYNLMPKYYELEICGLKRKLPLTAISPNTKLASFNILGDVELINKTAQTLKKKMEKYDFDYLVGPEVKVVPLIQKLAELMDQKKYVICRKSIKPYMVSPITLEPLPHFPNHVKKLVINGAKAEILKGKKVAVIDDVVSTGVTMRMIDKLMEKIGAEVVLHGAIIRQTKSQFDEIKNFIYLTELPIFKDN
jgi:adenine phosphoribosyltransferase